MRDAMAQEEYFIDLRQLLTILWQGKRLLLAFFVVFVLAAGAFSSFMPRQYEASAVVVVEFPRVPSTISSYLPAPYSIPDMNSLLAVLREDDVLQQVAAGEGIGVGALHGHVRVEAVGRHGVRLIVRDTDPARAARLANRWAGLVEDQARKMYDLEGMEAGWQAVVAQAQREYQQSAQAVETFWTRENVLRQLTWNEIQQEAACLFGREASLEAAQKELQQMQTQLQGLAEEAPVAEQTRARLWILLTQNWHAVVACENLPPLENPLVWLEPPSAMTVREAGAYIQQLEQSLAEAQEQLRSAQAALQDRADKIGEQKFRDEAVLQELLSQRANAWGTYVRLRDQGMWFQNMKKQGAIAHLMKSAEAPTKPVAPRLLMNVILGALLGLTLGTVVVWFKAWWGNSSQEAHNDR